MAEPRIHPEVDDIAADWLLLTAGNDDRDLQAGLQAWLAESEAHRRAYGRIRRMWHLSGALDLPARDMRPAEEGAAVRGTGATATEAAPPAHRPRRAPRRQVRRQATAIAAAAAVLAGLLAWQLPQLALQIRADARTGTADMRQVPLPDGSSIDLDGDSAIAVEISATRRAVTLLAGKAFFEVVQRGGVPFEVVAGGMTVRVTGTAFSVGNTGRGLSVAVRSGRVEVSLPDGGPPTPLEAGDRLAVPQSGGDATRTIMPPEDVGSWRTGHFSVDNVPLADVVEELDRHYPGMILLRGTAIAERRVTGLFDLERPEAAVEAIARSLGASVTALPPFLLLLSSH